VAGKKPFPDLEWFTAEAHSRFVGSGIEHDHRLIGAEQHACTGYGLEKRLNVRLEVSICLRQWCHVVVLNDISRRSLLGALQSLHPSIDAHRILNVILVSRRMNSANLHITLFKM
jgi:hypothetical protein